MDVTLATAAGEGGGFLRWLLGLRQIDPTDPTVHLSWPLLWAVAVLALVEMLLARWASHASKTGRSEGVMDPRAATRQAGRQAA